MSSFSSSISLSQIPYALPKNWKWYFWEDLIIDFQQGLIRSNSQLGSGNVGYLKMGDLDNAGTCSLSGIAKTNASPPEIEKFRLNENNFLINVRNSMNLVGKTCVVTGMKNETVLFNHMLVRVAHHDGIPNTYLNVFFNTTSGRKLINRCKQGTTTVIALYQRDLFRLPVPIPDEYTLDFIVNFTDAVSQKIELNNQINAELEAMAKLLYDYWFVQFDFPMTAAQATALGQPELEGKPYKTSGGKMVFNPTLKREIPEGWEVDNILQMSNLGGGGTPRKEEPNYWDGHIPFFTPTDAEPVPFLLDTEAHITEEGHEESSTKVFPEGSLFLTARGSVGKVMITGCEMAMSQSCYALLPHEGISSQFLFFQTHWLMDYLRIKSSGSIFKSIVTNDIKFSPTIVPPMQVISDFSKRTDASFEQIKNNQKQNQELTELRDWLLPMLMNGQVTVG